MGILGFLGGGDPLKRLEKEAEENPSPETYATLAQKHIEVEQYDQALRVAESGVKQWKDAAKLREIVAYVKKKRSADKIRSLRDDIRVQPTAAAYTELVDIFRDLGDVDQALDLCSEATTKFPEDTKAWLRIAQIRLENFFGDVIAYDGSHGLEALLRVRELEPANSTGRMLLAQFYYALGANALSVEMLREELAAEATALDVKDFLEDIGDPPPLDPGVTVEDLIERAEEFSEMPNSLQGFPRVNPQWAKRTSAPPKINTIALQGQLRELADTPGLRNILVVDREGKSVSSVQGENPVEETVLRDLTAGITEVAGDACRHMDIGSFRKGWVNVPGGGLTMQRQRGHTFALYYQDPLRQDKAAALLAEKVNQTMGGGAGA